MKHEFGALIYKNKLDEKTTKKIRSKLSIWFFLPAVMFGVGIHMLINPSFYWLTSDQWFVPFILIGLTPATFFLIPSMTIKADVTFVNVFKEGIVIKHGSKEQKISFNNVEGLHDGDKAFSIRLKDSADVVLLYAFETPSFEEVVSKIYETYQEHGH